MISVNRDGVSDGGWGSGRRWSESKRTTSSYRRLDVRYLQREDLLAAGRAFAWEWRRDGEVIASLSVRTKSDRIILSHRPRNDKSASGPIKECSILLARTQCNFGGARCWFVCPAEGCGRRVAILYFGKIFSCRHCCRLVYPSQRQSSNERALRKAQAIRIKLGGSSGVVGPIALAIGVPKQEDFPTKPLGMHWRTYKRLRRQAEEADLRSVGVKPPIWILRFLGLT
jgi:hypothetical protein